MSAARRPSDPRLRSLGVRPMNRPHPLGLTYHPEWPAVRDRWCERFCNAVLNPMPAVTDLPTPAPRSTMIRDAVAITLVLIVVWAVGLVVAG